MKNQYEKALDGKGSEKTEAPIDLSYDNRDLSSEGTGDLSVSSGSNPGGEKTEEKKEEETDLTSMFR